MHLEKMCNKHAAMNTHIEMLQHCRRRETVLQVLTQTLRYSSVMLCMAIVSSASDCCNKTCHASFSSKMQQHGPGRRAKFHVLTAASYHGEDCCRAQWQAAFYVPAKAAGAEAVRRARTDRDLAREVTGMPCPCTEASCLLLPGCEAGVASACCICPWTPTDGLTGVGMTRAVPPGGAAAVAAAQDRYQRPCKRL